MSLQSLWFSWCEKLACMSNQCHLCYWTWAIRGTYSEHSNCQLLAQNNRKTCIFGSLTMIASSLQSLNLTLIRKKNCSFYKKMPLKDYKEFKGLTRKRLFLEFDFSERLRISAQICCLPTIGYCLLTLNKIPLLSPSIWPYR